jgi:hypothetical protein
VSQWHKVHWHIVIILYTCATMTQITLTHCYHLIHMCHNDTMYKMKFMWRCTLCHCDTQIYDDNNVPMHFVPLWHTGIRWLQCVDVLCWHKVHWHIVIILYLCVTMTQSTLTHCYHLIHVCHIDTRYIDTLLSSYTCVSQWHKVNMITMCQCNLCHWDTQV